MWGKLGLALLGRAMLSKFLIQFSADQWGCATSPDERREPHRDSWHGQRRLALRRSRRIASWREEDSYGFVMAYNAHQGWFEGNAFIRKTCHRQACQNHRAIRWRRLETEGEDTLVGFNPAKCFYGIVLNSFRA